MSLSDGSFFFNDTATTEIYTLSLHDALPIYRAGRSHRAASWRWRGWSAAIPRAPGSRRDDQRERRHERLQERHAKRVPLQPPEANSGYRVIPPSTYKLVGDVVRVVG